MRKSLLALGLAVLVAEEAKAGTNKPAKVEPQWDVAYIWDPNVQTVIDHHQRMRRSAPEIANKLQIVRGNKNFGLVYDINVTESQARKIAKEHQGLGEATAIPDQEYEEVFNVCYGKSKDLTKIKTDFKQVVGMLGKGVGKELVIEKDGDNYFLIYQRRGGRASSAKVAQHHSHLLKKLGLSASISPEKGRNQIYGLESPQSNRSETGLWDVSYGWDTDVENILDQQDLVSKVLGEDVAKKLHIVQAGQKFGLIYDRNGNKHSSEEVASKHAAIVSGAIAIQDNGYEQLFNVSYGKGANLRQLMRDFKKVYTTLGEGVGKDLVIERINGDHVIVYRRRGNKSSSFEIAGLHAALLEKRGLSASITPEMNREVVYDIGMLLHEEEEPNRRKVVPPPLKVPKRGTKKRGENVPGIIPRAPNDLEAAIERYVKERKATDERTAWSVYDFTTGEKLVDINEDVPMQAASMVKPLVALAYFHKVKEGKLTYGPKSKRKLRASIQRSSNTATNWIMRQVGGPKAVDALLEKHYGGILPDTSIVEYIPAGGRTYRNKASAHDYSRFLFSLWNNQLPHSSEMRRLMSLPGRDRLYTGASEVPAGTLVYDKTGTTGRLVGDMGILYAKDHRGKRHAYTVVGIIEKSSKTSNFTRFSNSRGNIIRGVSNLTYQAMRKRHNLR
jgi:beta-lactamase class A